MVLSSVTDLAWHVHQVTNIYFILKVLEINMQNRDYRIWSAFCQC